MARWKKGSKFIKISKLRNRFLLSANKLLGNNSFFKESVRFFYLSCFIPVLRNYLKGRHPALKNVVIRNSLFDKKHFNPFLSDVDITLVIQDGFNSKKLIQDFLKIKKIFIMLDYPEVYSESEYKTLLEIQQKSSWKIIDVIWNIRKMNWCLSSLQNQADELTILKMNRSIEKSLSKILRSEKKPSRKQFFISDFKYFEILFNTELKNINVSYNSGFLGNQKGLMILELSRVQFHFLDSLMPAEKLYEPLKEQMTPFYLECKLSLALFERLITLSSIRLKEAQNESTESLHQWLSWQEHILIINENEIQLRLAF